MLQPDGGFLWAERCVQAHGDAARAEGAELHSTSAFSAGKAAGDGGVSVRTDRATYEAGPLVLCPGAWAGDLTAAAGRGLSRRRASSWRGSRRAGPPLFAPRAFRCS